MAGADLIAVKEILGHRDIETTLTVSAKHLAEAANKGSLLGASSETVAKLDVGEGRVVQPIERLVRLTGFEPVALSSGG